MMPVVFLLSPGFSFAVSLYCRSVSAALFQSASLSVYLSVSLSVSVCLSLYIYSELCCKTCSLSTPSPPLNTSPGKTALASHFRTYKYKVTCMCFSAINGSGPAYLSELLHVYTPSRTLRSSSDTRILEIQQYKRKTHGFRTFSCFGPHIWNSLPQHLRHCSTLSSFKAKLKTFLFSQYFHHN